MVLLSVELSRLVSDSDDDVSRRMLSEIQVDKDLRLKDQCAKNCTKHCHGVVIEASQNQNYMMTLSGMSIIPRLVVIESALQMIGHFQVL